MQQQHGSGKTAVLVERIINKIINEKIDIDKLLVVTFTNAAASEMKERVLKAIYKIIDEANENTNEDKVYDEETINHLQRQITLLNKANICTIDSFCLDVIRNNFFEIEISPNFRIADKSEIDLLKQEVLENIFEEKYEKHDSNFEKLITTYTSYRDDTPLKDLILKIYTYIGSNPFPIEWLENQVEKFNITDIKQDFSENIWGKILLKIIKEELEDDIKKLKAEEKRISVEKDLKSCQNVINSDISQYETLYANLDNWDKAYTIAQRVDFIRWAAPRNVQSDILKDVIKDAKGVRDNIKDSFVSKREKIFTSNSEEANVDLKNMYEILLKLKNLIIDFDKEFKKAKKEKNIVDFNDIEHFALEILVKSNSGKIEASEIAKKYQEKFQEIAIDEYQDSNLVQEYILTSISKGNNIFMVGDVKQSIYKFRQAMPDLFLGKYKNYSENEANENGLKIKLFKNFRSRQNVLDFTNIIFENIMGANLGEIDYTKEEYLNLGADYEKEKQSVVTEVDILNITQDMQNNKDTEQSNVNDDISNEDTNDDDVEEQESQEKIEDIELEAKYVAKKIRDLIDSKFQIYDNKNKLYRDIQYKDIVILLRSTKSKANIYEKELINQNIDVYSDTSSEYLDSYEIQVIMDLLKIIDNPYQDLPLVHIMLSCIGMFTNDDLLEIRLCDKTSDFYTAMLKARLSVEEDLKQKIQIFLDKIEDFRNKNKYMDLDELIWTIYEETGFLNYVALMPNGELRCTNLKMLFERAKQYETASFKGLFNFINFIERLKIGNSDLGSAKLIGENENVVRIMSIHKSKGLEFPIVFLSSTGSSFNMRDLNEKILLHQELGIGVKYIDYEKQVRYDTLSKIALREKLFEENLAEEMRVLYVALTRAKEKLYITAIKKDFEKENEKMQDLVNMYEKEDGKINPILLKKHKKYIDWILLVYLYNKDKIQDIMELNILNKKDIIKDMNQEDEEEEAVDVFALLEEYSKDVKDEDIIALKNELVYEYKFKDLINIPTKASVTGIVHKDIEKQIYSYLLEDEGRTSNEEKEVSKFNQSEIEINQNEETEETQELPKPKFIVGTEEEKITSAKRGTLVHLCMKNLDFTQEYDLEKIELLIQDLKARQIITEKEADSIDSKTILQFTKSKIWQELKTAKEAHKEEPFYINVPAKDVVDVNVDENILVQGIIDLYYINSVDELVLLDYKTDFVKQGEEQILIDRHKPQLMLYKEALEGALNKKVSKVYIYSTALGKEILI